jgi:methylmalonyl-CoA/ethylmalonyl-CoA epimerase
MRNISRIDHISIAVQDPEKARDFFVRILGAIPGAEADDSTLGFNWKILSLGDLTRIEIISPKGEKSFLDGFLKDRQGGVHHITLETPDIKKIKALLEKENIPYFGYAEYPGGWWKELFIHPKNAFGVLIQIAQFDPDTMLGSDARLQTGKLWEIKKINSGALLTMKHPGGGKTEYNLTDNEINMLIEDLKNIKDISQPDHQREKETE